METKQIQETAVVNSTHKKTELSCEKCQELKQRISILEREAVNAAKSGRFLDVYVLMLASAKLDLQEHKKEMSA